MMALVDQEQYKYLDFRASQSSSSFRQSKAWNSNSNLTDDASLSGCHGAQAPGPEAAGAEAL